MAAGHRGPGAQQALRRPEGPLRGEAGWSARSTASRSRSSRGRRWGWSANRGAARPPRPSSCLGWRIRGAAPCASRARICKPGHGGPEALPPLHPGGLPGPLRLPQPAHARERDHRGAADHQRVAPGPRGTQARGAAPRPGRAARPLRGPLPPRVLRRPAPAHRHRAGPRAVAQADRVDEPVSALDVSIRAQILNLLRDLQSQLQLSYLFIAHDLAAVAHMSHTIAVMYLGKIVETGDARTLANTPKHPYTAALFSAALPSHPEERREEIILPGEVPSPLRPPDGCQFHPRCPRVMERCSVEEPALAAMEAVGGLPPLRRGGGGPGPAGAPGRGGLARPVRERRSRPPRSGSASIREGCGPTRRVHWVACGIPATSCWSPAMSWAISPSPWPGPPPCSRPRLPPGPARPLPLPLRPGPGRPGARGRDRRAHAHGAAHRAGPAARIRDLNPGCHVCFFGLYAGLNAAYLLGRGADSFIAGEAEAPLVALVEALAAGGDWRAVPGVGSPGRPAPPTCHGPACPCRAARRCPRSAATSTSSATVASAWPATWRRAAAACTSAATARSRPCTAAASSPCRWRCSWPTPASRSRPAPATSPSAIRTSSTAPPTPSASPGRSTRSSRA